MIELNEAEKILSIMLAIQRYSSNRNCNIEDRKIGGQPEWITDLDGIGGELIVAKRLNVYPDMNIKPQRLTADLIRNGKKIDVKTTVYENGKLLAPLNKKIYTCDIYILVVGRFPKYRIAGWAKAEDLINEKRIKDLGYGDTYAMEQNELRKFNGQE